VNTTVTGWRRWIPTDKWIGSAVISAGAILGSWVGSGAFDDVERGMAASAIPALIGAYFLSNKDRLVPTAKE
jgi:hypothetical protein